MTETKPNKTTWFFGLSIKDEAITPTGKGNIHKLYISAAIGISGFAASAIIFFGKKAFRGLFVGILFLAATYAVKWVAKQAAHLAARLIMPTITNHRNQFIKDFLMSD